MDFIRWHYHGKIDCFGMEQRDRFFNELHLAAVESGGELQIQPLEAGWDSEEYQLYISWTTLAKPFAAHCSLLADLLPEGHKSVYFTGHCPSALEREDIMIEDNQVFLVPYHWQADDACPYYADPEWRENFTTAAEI